MSKTKRYLDPFDPRYSDAAIRMQALKGKFRTRQTGYEFVLEELRNGNWHIIESLFSWQDVDQAIQEYSKDGHDIHHHY